jgi:uncharacterized protein YaeQ
MARLLGYTLYTTDQQAFEQAKSRLTQGDEASALTGKDPAGVTLHLHFGHPDLKTEAAA